MPHHFIDFSYFFSKGGDSTDPHVFSFIIYLIFFFFFSPNFFFLCVLISPNLTFYFSFVTHPLSFYHVNWSVLESKTPTAGFPSSDRSDPVRCVFWSGFSRGGMFTAGMRKVIGQVDGSYAKPLQNSHCRVWGLCPFLCQKQTQLVLCVKISN